MTHGGLDRDYFERAVSNDRVHRSVFVEGFIFASFVVDPTGR